MDLYDYILQHNRKAWDWQVQKGNTWTIPVSPEEIAAARQGHWHIYLTPSKPVPQDWFPNLNGLDVLCLACGGGQQAPVLAAAGARVTVFDNSDRQLEQDRLVAARENLKLRTIQGDMADLSVFPDESFDLIFHPVSNCFAPDVQPVWRAAFRVLRLGGALLAGIANPVIYIFDHDEYASGRLLVRHALPYSDVESLSEEQKQHYIEQGQPFEFSHTLEDQIGGQAEAGFSITGFYEDRDQPSENDLLSRYMPTYFAARAEKLTGPIA